MGVKRVLVTGAAGFTGRHACRRLAASGWEVVAVVSGRRQPLGMTESAGFAPAEKPAADASSAGVAGLHVRTVSCDLTDREAVRAVWAAARPHALLHLAGQNAVDRSWREPDLTLAANALSTAYLLEAMRAGGGCGRAVIVGSMLREPVTLSSHPYAYSKTVQATAALAWHRWYGLPVVVAEPSNLIGPGGSAGLCGKIARWAAAAEAGGRAAAAAAGADLAGAASAASVAPFRLSSLEERRDYLDVRDAALAYEVLLERGEPGASYAIESGTMRSLRDVKEAFERLSLVPLRWEVGASEAPSPSPRDCEAIRSLGWEPAVAFADSVAEMLAEERGKLEPKREGGEAP